MDNHTKPQPTAREDIMSAFWTLYQKKSIEKISIREITQLAGYNRGTFYNHFTDIYDALNRLQDFLLDYTQVMIDEYRKNGAHYQVFIKYMGDIFYERAEYFSVFLGENRDPNFSSKMKSVMRPVFFEVWGLSEDDKTAGYLFEFALSAIIGSLTHWYRSGGNIPYETFLTLLRSMLMGGVLPEMQKISDRTDLVLSLKDFQMSESAGDASLFSAAEDASRQINK